MSLNPEEISRYSRHLNMAEFGIEEQTRLKLAKILVIGAGGLGCPALLYLSAAGIGTIGIVEFDEVDLSNLQRQILYTSDDIGKSKVKRAIQHLKKINPHVNFIEHPVALTSANARSIITQYDIVIDGTDNFPTRYLVNDACILENKPNVYGSVLRFEGQVSVFNYCDKDGVFGPNYRDLFPIPPPAGLVPNCAQAGVLGVLPGIIGSMQAAEAIKIAAGIGEPLSGRLWIFDALSFESRIMKFKKKANHQIKELIDYDIFCGISKPVKGQISPREAYNQAKSNPEVVVIDVREEFEYHLDNITAFNIPLSELLERIAEIPNDKEIIVHCQSGKRSLQAIHLIKKEYEDIKIYNLKGGLNSWRKEMDKTNLPN